MKKDRMGDPAMTAPVLLVDLSSIGHPIYHVSQREPDPDYTSQRTVAIVRELAANHPHTAICCDSATSFRKDLDSTYKANRPTAEAALHHQIDLAAEALGWDGFPVWRVEGFEGDDLIATATKELTAEMAGYDSTKGFLRSPIKILIASADKDLLALVSDHVEVHSTRTGERIGPDEVMGKLGVAPSQVEDYLTVVGDTSDNIRGAKGIGPKTAAAMLTMYDSLDDLYARNIGDDTVGVTPAQLASLAELSTRLDGVRALVHMRTDVPLDVAAVFKERVPRATAAFMEDKPMGDREAPTPVDPSQVKPDPPPAPPPKGPPATAALVAEVKENLAGLVDQERESGLSRSLGPAPPEWERGLEPRSMDDARQLAKWMHESRMFSAYGTPQAVLSTVLLGRELGLPAMAALRSVHVIEGKHSLSADLMVGLILKSGLAEYFQLIESTDELCTFETKRKGAPKPMRLTYTIEQAKQAGLLQPTRSGKPSAWQKMQKIMLTHRAKAGLGRLEYPDLLSGLYTPDELRDAKEGDKS